jgi:hypothetical protein
MTTDTAPTGLIAGYRVLNRLAVVFFFTALLALPALIISGGAPICYVWAAFFGFAWICLRVSAAAIRSTAHGTG